MSAALQKEGNIWAAYRKERAAWFPEDLKKKHGLRTEPRRPILPVVLQAMWNRTSARPVFVARCSRGGLHHGGRKENLLWNAYACCRQMGCLLRGAEKNVQVMKEAGVDTVITLPRLQHDVAPGLSVWLRAGYRIRHRCQTRIAS